MNNEITTTENYAKAIEVHRRITLNAQLAQTAIVEMCKGLKMMKDEKLYESLGYGEFEEYAEKEFNIKRRQAYKYISIAENLNKNFVQSTAQIGTEKLYLLSTLSEEQQTEINDITDIEKITVRQLKEQIKELERRADSITQEKAHAEAEIAALQNVNGKLIKAIEDKPVEVAVEVPVPNEEYEKKLKEFEQQKEQAKKEIAKLKAEINTGKQPESPEKIKFKILLTAAYDSVQRAVEFIQTVDSSQNRELYLRQIRKIMTLIN